MSRRRRDGLKADGHINMKVPASERAAFREWCARHRLSQVDAFRIGFYLLSRADRRDRGEPKSAAGNAGERQSLTADSRPVNMEETQKEQHVAR